METIKVSKKLLNRLPGYLNHLNLLPPERENVSAAAIARALGLGEVQVRKDLAKISSTGRRRTGRCREQLIQDIEKYLDFANESGAIIVGTGKLGCALLDYEGFDKAGLNVMAGFDIQPTRAQSERGKPIYPMTRLETFCRRYQVRIGIITVPAEAAQEVCDGLIACGIEAIWNFAPVRLWVPETIPVKNENLALSLAALRLELKHREDQIRLHYAD